MPLDSIVFTIFFMSQIRIMLQTLGVGLPVEWVCGRRAFKQESLTQVLLIITKNFISLQSLFIIVAMLFFLTICNPPSMNYTILAQKVTEAILFYFFTLDASIIEIKKGYSNLTIIKRWIFLIKYFPQLHPFKM